MDSSPFAMCAPCLRDSEKVRSIVIKQPNLSIEEVSQLTEVSLPTIQKLIKIGWKSKIKN